MIFRRSGEIFLSHASADRERVETVCSRIEALGFSCWRSPRDVPEGADYAASIHAAIERCRLFVVVLSPQSAASRHVRREVDIADRLGREVIPIRISDSTSFGVLDYFVNTAQWIDLTNAHDDGAFRSLADMLQDRLGPRRALLAIDGGGPLGLLSLGVLKGIESALASAPGASRVATLRDAFDLISGSGTGAFIGAAIHAGRTLEEIEDFLISMSPKLFGASVPLEQCYAFSARSRLDPKMARVVESFIGLGTTLGSGATDRMLAMTLRQPAVRVPWTLTNNPKAKYNQPGPQRPSNLEMPLGGLAYASLLWHPGDAFDLRIQRDQRSSYAVGDGTFTPYCNPAFLAFQLSTAAPYRLEWAASERRMMLVSVGTGQRRAAPLPPTAGTLGQHLPAFIAGSVDDQDLKCRLFGRCLVGPILDREVGDLVERHDAEGHGVKRHPELTP